MLSKKAENFYLWAIKILIFLIPLLPLYISSSTVFPYITGKNFAFRILVEAAAALWLGLLTINKEYRLRNSPLVFSILAFTFIVGLADTLGINPYNSFWSNYERMEGYVTILHLTLYFMIAKSVLRTRRDWVIFLNIFIVAGIFVSSYALIAPLPTEAMGYVQIYGARLPSTIGNPPFLASYLLLTIFLGLILIFNTQKNSLRYVYLLSVVLNSIVIYFTASRGAIFAALIGVLLFSLFYISGRSNSPKEELFKKIVLSVLGAIIVLLAVFWIFGNNEFIRQNETLSRFYDMLSDPSVKSRLSVWKMAWEGVMERPLLGWGQENFIGVYTISPNIWKPSPSAWMDRAHNIVLDWLVNAGFSGLFSYISIFGSAFYVIRTSFRKNIVAKNEAVVIVIALIVYFIQNLFTFDTISTYVAFFTLLAYIDNLDHVKRISYSEVNIKPKKSDIKSVIISLLALLILSGAAYFINYKPMRECQLLYRISDSFPEKYKSYLPLLDDFNEALSFKAFGDTDVRLRMDRISVRIFKRKLFTEPGALKFIQATAEELKKVAAANPHNLKYWTYLINLYNAIAFYEPSYIARTEALIKECMSISPEYQWLYFALADIYMLKKDHGNAFVAAQTGVAIDPQNDKMQLKLAHVAILASREKEATNALENIKKIRMSKNPDISPGKEHVLSIAELLELAHTSLKIKDFSKALQFLKVIITISPEEAQYHFDIAVVYLKLNDKVNAVREAKKAAEMDPLNYAEKVEKFINSIN